MYHLVDTWTQQRLINKINKQLPDIVIFHIIQFCRVNEITSSDHHHCRNLRFLILLILYVGGSYLLGSVCTGYYWPISMIFLNLLIGYFLFIFGVVLLSFLILIISGKKAFNRFTQTIFS